MEKTLYRLRMNMSKKSKKYRDEEKKLKDNYQKKM